MRFSDMSLTRAFQRRLSMTDMEWAQRKLAALIARLLRLISTG